MTDTNIVDFAEKAKEIFGTTFDCGEAGFILPDGTLLSMKKGGAGQKFIHSKVREVFSGDIKDPSRKFMQETGAVRIYPASNTTFLEILSNDLSKEQKDAILFCACDEGKKPHRIVYDIIKNGEIIAGSFEQDEFLVPKCDEMVRRFVSQVEQEIRIVKKNT